MPVPCCLVAGRCRARPRLEREREPACSVFLLHVDRRRRLAVLAVRCVHAAVPAVAAAAAAAAAAAGPLATLLADLVCGSHGCMERGELAHHALVLLSLVGVDGLGVLAEVVEAGELLVAVAGERALAGVLAGEGA
jgi:hypothetical protein